MTTGSSFMARYPPPCQEIQSIISTTEETFLDETQENSDSSKESLKTQANDSKTQ